MRERFQSLAEIMRIRELNKELLEGNAAEPSRLLDENEMLYRAENEESSE